MRGIDLVLLVSEGTGKGGGIKVRGKAENRNKNFKKIQDGLTTSVHSHCSMSSMTEF